MGGGAIDADRPGAARPLERVGHQPSAARGVPNVHGLERQDARGIQQVSVDGYAALISQVRVRHRGTMDLRLEHGEFHGWLLMRRVMEAHDLRVLLSDPLSIVPENAADNLAVRRESRYPKRRQQSSSWSPAPKGVISTWRTRRRPKCSKISGECCGTCCVSAPRESRTASSRGLTATSTATCASCWRRACSARKSCSR